MKCKRNLTVTRFQRIGQRLARRKNLVGAFSRISADKAGRILYCTGTSVVVPQLACQNFAARVDGLPAAPADHSGNSCRADRGGAVRRGRGGADLHLRAAQKRTNRVG